MAAAAAIRAGKLVVLPTETVYGLAADPSDPASVARAAQLKGRIADKAMTYHLSSLEQLLALAPRPGVRVQRLIDRYWPGPLTVLVPGHRGDTLGFRMPASPFTRAVIAELGSPLFLTSVNRSGEAPLLSPDEILATFGASIDLLCDGGPPKLKTPSTVVDCTRPVLRVLREGILAADEVLATAARTVLFVCSGNTCRSPLAEAIARDRASRQLGIAPADLLARGFRFVSAGTNTMHGMPASDQAVAAAREAGLDLTGHRSQPLTRELLRAADIVLCMTASHRQRLLEAEPTAESRTWLLDPGGEDVGDPFGGDLATYQRTRDEIVNLIEQRLAELTAEG